MPLPAGLDKGDLMRMVEEKHRKIERLSALRTGDKRVEALKRITVAGAPNAAPSAGPLDYGDDMPARTKVVPICGDAEGDDADDEKGETRAPPPSTSQMYGGMGARARELQAHGFTAEEARAAAANPSSPTRNISRNLSYAGRLPLQILTGRRARRPQLALRGGMRTNKIGPGH